LEFPITPNAGKKLLANPWRRGKRIEVLNTNQSVPKKNKIVQAEIGGEPAGADESPAGIEVKKASKSRRARAARKRAPARKEAAPARKANFSMPPEAGTTAAGPSDDEIRMRAYFISERRRRFALPGDADSDWLEAKRQLLSETGPR
jgi:Protein of unknown function (DUF2934)